MQNLGNLDADRNVRSKTETLRVMKIKMDDAERCLNAKKASNSLRISTSIEEIE